MAFIHWILRFCSLNLIFCRLEVPKTSVRATFFSFRTQFCPQLTISSVNVVTDIFQVVITHSTLISWVFFIASELWDRKCRKTPFILNFPDLQTQLSRILIYRFLPPNPQSTAFGAKVNSLKKSGSLLWIGILMGQTKKGAIRKIYLTVQSQISRICLAGSLLSKSESTTSVKLLTGVS